MPAACSAIRFDLRRSGMLESRESRLAEACVIPFRDDNPTRSVPIVTIGLIAVNVAVYLYQVVLPGLRQELFIYTHAAIPAVLLGQVGLEQVLPHQLLAAAHHYHIPILPVQPAWLTIFTAMFIHGGFMHIAGNMLYLWIFGNNVEDLLGSVRFVVFYFICGTVAAALQIAFSLHSPVPMIGASGAIAGVLGAYYIKFPQARVQCLVFLFLFITVISAPGRPGAIALVLAAGPRQPRDLGAKWCARRGGRLRSHRWLCCRLASHPPLRASSPPFRQVQLLVTCYSSGGGLGGTPSRLNPSWA